MPLPLLVVGGIFISLVCSAQTNGQEDDTRSFAIPPEVFIAPARSFPQSDSESPAAARIQDDLTVDSGLSAFAPWEATPVAFPQSTPASQPTQLPPPPAIRPALPPPPPSAFEPFQYQESSLEPQPQLPIAEHLQNADETIYFPVESEIEGTAFAPVITQLDPPMSTRPLADHWTPWYRWRRAVQQPGPLRRIGNLFWQESGRAHSATCDLGIGHERVMFAPSVVDTAIGTPSIGLQVQSDRGLNLPDRASYYWGTAGLGPGFDPEVHALDTRFRMELGNERATVITEFQLRSLDPTVVGNTTGIGDMVVGGKATMLDGRRLKLATIFKTYLPTGVEARGLGTGHVSLEPGMLMRYCLSPKTYAFAELKYWTPIAADPDYEGDVLTTGWALSTVLRESDVYAVIPTLEVRTLSFLFGGQTQADGNRHPIDGRTVVEIYPGARWVIGPEGDLGLWELNFAGGITVAEDAWFETRMVLGLRWNY